jgi:hypothetical protein
MTPPRCRLDINRSRSLNVTNPHCTPSPTSASAGSSPAMDFPDILQQIIDSHSRPFMENNSLHCRHAMPTRRSLHMPAQSPFHSRAYANATPSRPRSGHCHASLQWKSSTVLALRKCECHEHSGGPEPRGRASRQRAGKGLRCDRAVTSATCGGVHEPSEYQLH